MILRVALHRMCAPAILLTAMLMPGCEGDAHAPATAPANVDDHTGHDHGGDTGETAAVDWCPEHDVPESVCTRCNPELIAKFKASGDWCGGHGLPESQCLICNPELEAKFAAMRPKSTVPDAPSDDAEIVVEPWRSPLRPINDAACQVESSQIRFVDPSIAKKAGIRTQAVAARSMSAAITCPGEIGYNATRLAHITARSPGVMADVRAELGDAVTEDQVLATIDSAVLGRTKSGYIEARENHLLAVADLERHNAIHDAVEAMLKACDTELSIADLRRKFADARVGDAKSRLLNAHAQLDLAQQRFDRERELLEKGVSSQESLQSAKATLNKAEADFAATHEDIDIGFEKEHLALERAVKVARVALDAARRGLLIAGVSEAEIDDLAAGKEMRLGRYEVRSPMAGVIVNRHAVVGESIDTQTPLFTVADLSTMWLTLSLEERDLAVAGRGAGVLFLVDGLPGRSFAGRLEWISSEVDPRTRTVSARTALDNGAGLLRANMFGQARVQVRDEEEVLAVPVEAVQSDGCCTLAFVRQSDTLFRPRKIELGVTSNGYVEVIKGLASGEPVVTTGSFLMKTEIMKGSIGAGCCEVEPGR